MLNEEKFLGILPEIEKRSLEDQEKFLLESDYSLSSATAVVALNAFNITPAIVYLVGEGLWTKG